VSLSFVFGQKPKHLTVLVSATHKACFFDILFQTQKWVFSPSKVLSKATSFVLLTASSKTTWSLLVEKTGY